MRGTTDTRCPRLAVATRRLRLLPHTCFQAYIPEDKLQEVKRVLYGCNMGKPVGPVDLPKAVTDLAQAANFDCKAFKFAAAPEQLRPPRVVRIGLVQHGILLPTTDPYAAQLRAIRCRVEQLVEAAGAAKVNVLCLQEAW